MVGDVVDALGTEPDLAVLFATEPHREFFADMVDVVRRLLAPRVLLAVTTESLIGGPHEVELRPGVSLWAGRTGPVTPVRLDALPDGVTPATRRRLAEIVEGLPPAADW